MKLKIVRAASVFLTLVLSLSFTLLIGIAAAFVRELRRNVILGEWELPEHVTILGRIPRIEFSAADVANSPFTEPT